MRLVPVTSHATLASADIAPRDVHAPASLAQIAPADEVKAHAQDTTMRAVRLSRLIGARVSGGIDFSGLAPTPRGPAIPLYHHPADTNAVATRLATPGMLDLQA
ncbi:MAG: hypothetical protein KDA20_01975 [Phycisphaerales bacterium]|nr:hypothetical protein [Phycisphaerales bacterium]